MQIRLYRFLSALVFAICLSPTLLWGASSSFQYKYDYVAMAEYSKVVKGRRYDFAPVCHADYKGTPGTKCIDDVFVSARVQMLQAVALCQEYGRVKLNKELICYGKYRTSWPDDYVMCASEDNREQYEFRFDTVNASVDTVIQRSVGVGICEMHDERVYGDEDGAYVSCSAPQGKCLGGITKSAERFAFKADWNELGDESCVIKNNSVNADEYELKTYYDVNPNKFTYFQIQSSGDLMFLLQHYVKRMAEKHGDTLKSFNCKGSFITYLTGEKLNPKDDLLQCFANGHQIDFLFDDMSEFEQDVSDNWLKGLRCLATEGSVYHGGVYDGENCYGLTSTQCSQIPGTEWDDDLEVCILKDERVLLAQLADLGMKHWGVVLSGLALAVGGWRKTEVWLFFIGDLMAAISQEAKEKKVQEFLAKSAKCSNGNADCAIDALKFLFDEKVILYFDDMGDGLLNDTLSEEAARLEGMILEDDTIWGKSIELAAESFEGWKNFQQWSWQEWMGLAGKTLIAMGAIKGSGAMVLSNSSKALAFAKELKFTRAFSSTIKFKKVALVTFRKMARNAGNATLANDIEWFINNLGNMDDVMDTAETLAEMKRMPEGSDMAYLSNMSYMAFGKRPVEKSMGERAEPEKAHRPGVEKTVEIDLEKKILEELDVDPEFRKAYAKAANPTVSNSDSVPAGLNTVSELDVGTFDVAALPADGRI